MHSKIKGIVIKVTPFSENNKYLTVLSDQHGVISVLCRGGKRATGRLSALSDLLCYSEMTLFQKGERYILDEGMPIESFVGVTRDITKFSLGCYFCDLVRHFCQTREDSGDMLRLLLNSLHFLAEGSRPAALLKAVFELRLLSLIGFMPQLGFCHICGSFEGPVMYFSESEANLVCASCAAAQERAARTEVNKTVLSAMRHIVYSDFTRLFSFQIPQKEIGVLGEIAERYTLHHTETNLKTLQFYKVMAQAEGENR